MKYKVAHPRKVRGEAIHQPQNEKIGEIKIKKEQVKVETKMPSEAFNQKITNAGIYYNNEYNGTEHETQEEYPESQAMSYLVPDVDHFVDAPDVEKIKVRLKLWLTSGFPVHLIGPTGCGKTSLAMFTAQELGRPIVWINGDESITTADLIGGYSQVEQETIRDKYVHNVFKSRDILKAQWIDNPLAIACKYGYTLIYNEFSRTKPGANNILLSVFEEGILELPTKFGEERYIKVHPDFNAILTSNSVEYAGVHRPQDALLDRMVSIYMDYYSFDTEVKIVSEHSGVGMNEAKKIVNVVRELRVRLPDAQKPGTRMCIMIGKGLKSMRNPDDVNFEQLCLDVITSKTSSPTDLLEKHTMLKDALSVWG